MYNDQLLIQEFLQGGKTESINQLLKKHHNFILSICIKYSSDLEEAKDNLQDILIKVLEKVHTYSFESKFSTWLYAIARNYCYDQISKKNRSIAKLGEYVKSADQYTEFSMDDEIDDNSALKNIFKELDKDDQNLLIMKYLNKKSIQEISELSGLSPSCIKMRLSRAKSKARNRLY